MGKIAYLIRILCALFFVMSFLLVGCKNANLVILIEAPTSVYEDYPKGGPPDAKVIAILNKGEKVEVINSRWAKDFEYFKIRLKDGRTGYVGWDGKFSVESRTEKIQ